jgi:hypothetical protein
MRDLQPAPSAYGDALGLAPCGDQPAGYECLPFAGVSQLDLRAGSAGWPVIEQASTLQVEFARDALGLQNLDSTCFTNGIWRQRVDQMPGLQTARVESTVAGASPGASRVSTLLMYPPSCHVVAEA